MKDLFRVRRINDGDVQFEVQRLWSNEEWVGCFKAETSRDARNWINERNQKEKENIKENMEIRRQYDN